VGRTNRTTSQRETETEVKVSLQGRGRAARAAGLVALLMLVGGGMNELNQAHALAGNSGGLGVGLSGLDGEGHVASIARAAR
jgi:hypothetical protein